MSALLNPVLLARCTGEDPTLFAQSEEYPCLHS